jgi:sugar phosphate isomerase/epimerase
VPQRSIGITMDTGHFTASGVDLVAFADCFADRIAHIHLKDHVGERCVPLGAGETDNAALLATLRRRGFEGYATLELEVEDREHTLRYLAEARDYCARVLDLT